MNNDFETFKSNWQRFNPGNTPELEARMLKQYQQYLQDRADMDVFEPVNEGDRRSRLSNYDKELQAFLQPDALTSIPFYYLIQPSFTGESLLILEQHEKEYQLTYLELSKNYFQFIYYQKNEEPVKTITQRELSKPLGDRLMTLLGKNIRQARNPDAQRIVLDGTQYRLSMMIDGEPKQVFKHSPSPDSQTGRIIDLLDKLVSYTKDRIYTITAIELALYELEQQ
ncbi:hypothetical protein HNQ91_001758 [Filimonas zeae]|uniref:Uncharacterized protein n=1 Tax=Filimonas zeae TaxID=1737353 RepID=A0A917MVW2_9BACT|nr:hypothetical protein [Filimonas zeae]MDR6338707.1 hypothetical protein [Filimonas zeae]GGH66967.1 hypothetical protein GCM10011379_21700 [Filimonas zeae]